MKKDKIELRFSDDVSSQLGHYVYRLIDPRNANTFYVGRGQGNRVFSHVRNAFSKLEKDEYIKDYMDNDSNNVDLETSAKLRTIQNIIDSGLEVIHIIQRWGLNEDEAREVEAALIDSYAGLDNEIGGYDRDRGVISTSQLIKNLEKEEFEESINNRFIVIKIKQSSHDFKGNYEATRASWVLSKKRAQKYDYVLSVISGVVVEVYKVNKWEDDQQSKKRYKFEGVVAEDEIRNKYIDKKLPGRFRKKGSSNPVQYSHPD